MSALRVACILEQATYKPGDQAPESYLAWHEWAEVQHKAGLRQKQCGSCGLWRYPQELSEHMVRWQGFTARGKPAHQMAPLCLKCEARSKTPNAGLNRPGSRSEAEAGGSELKPLLGAED